MFCDELAEAAWKLVAALCLTTACNPAHADGSGKVRLQVFSVSFYGDATPKKVTDFELMIVVNETRYTLEAQCCSEGGLSLGETVRKFEVPANKSYAVRFELGEVDKLHNSRIAGVYNAKSMYVQVVPVITRGWRGLEKLIPSAYAEVAKVIDYPLYEVRGGTREAAVSAVVRYNLIFEP